MASADLRLESSALGTDTVSGSDTVLGFHLAFGGNLNISETSFIGFEVLMHRTGDASITDDFMGIPVEIESDLDGDTISLVFGMRL